MTIKKICCLRLNQVGVPFSALIAKKCPEIRVTVVHTNTEYDFQCKTKKIPGLWDLIRQCQNKNLVFSTNEEEAVKEADIVFIISESKDKKFGLGREKSVDLSGVEDAARLIAQYAITDKIIVESSSSPLLASDCIRRVLEQNSRPGLHFQVLSHPEFYKEGSAVQNLLTPDPVLIGCEKTPEGLDAAKKLSFLYERWVPTQKILIKSNWMIELAKVGVTAIKAQTMANMLALSAICEESSGDVREVAKVLVRFVGLGPQFSEPSLSLGDFPRVVNHLVYLCQNLHLREAAEYWRSVLDMFSYYSQRFFNNVIYTLSLREIQRRICVMGFAHFAESSITKDSVAIPICKKLLNEGCALSIYDSIIVKKQVLDDLLFDGVQTPGEPDYLGTMIEVYEDPYKAASNCSAIIVCASCPEVSEMDFANIYKVMNKPAYIFDTGYLLPFSDLSKIGFFVHPLGMKLANN